MKLSDFENVIFNYRVWVKSCNSTELYDLLSNCLQKSGFTVLQTCEHQFHPQGYTALWLLAESHLAVHTFPERKASYIELSSCNLQKRTVFEELLKTHLIIYKQEE